MVQRGTSQQQPSPLTKPPSTSLFAASRFNILEQEQGVFQEPARGVGALQQQSPPNMILQGVSPFRSIVVQSPFISQPQPQPVVPQQQQVSVPIFQPPSLPQSSSQQQLVNTPSSSNQKPEKKHRADHKSQKHVKHAKNPSFKLVQHKNGSISVQHNPSMKGMASEKDKMLKKMNALIDAILVVEQSQLQSQQPQRIYSCNELFEVKTSIESNISQIDSFAKIDLYLVAETLCEKTKSYLGKILSTVKPEMYFILKSFVYFTNEIKYSLLKGDEVSKYRKQGLLEYDDHISNEKRTKIFLDGGRGHENGSVSREIIVVNEAKDTKLRELLHDLTTRLQLKFPNAKTNGLSGGELKIFYAYISEFVSACMGGYSPNIADFSSTHISNLAKQRKSKYIFIGDVRFGVCRHRSILFKYICDYLFMDGFKDIRCRLVRGKCSGGNHAWNIVSIIDTKSKSATLPDLYLVDIMRYPGHLYSVSSVDADLYKQQSFGTIGGHSQKGLATDLSKLQYKEKKLLGRGASGKVFSCVVYIPEKGETVCAVKKVPLSFDNVNFERELKLLNYLSHPNIIQLYHAALVKNKHGEHCLHMFMELMDCNARKFINDFKANYMNQPKYYVYELLFFLSNVANGLNYLHLRGCVHRDVKPENIAIKYYRRHPHSIEEVKLVDFDVANIVHNSKTICGTRGYCDPLVFSTASSQIVAKPFLDCFSFGILLAEFFLEHPPKFFFDSSPSLDEGYEKLQNYYSPANIQFTIMKSGKYDCIPSKYRASLTQMMINCIQTDVTKRPTMQQIASELENYLLKNFIIKAEEDCQL
ncbi:hypothetical protein C9374_012725 [Naegleria lovaniensis]|uniref:Protein kinase domain-containing protein n=1 Tax=Naegleria lovaniensis TaxID=51637 RepID=A0AA88H0B7_NAELO|nr:uncharacterized protein C9374_012725 [Naegleria lovaniensis]KAG2392473.1 hypothetical protein C9374_012725 [Naegleria lovaniensis]